MFLFLQLDKWDYQENGGFKKELCKTFGNNLNKFNSKENLDKNSSPVPLLVCGIGEGKSRALQEAPKMLKKLAEDSKTFSQVLVFQVTFENGTPVDKKLNTCEQVPLRILYHLSDQTISYSQFEIANGNQGLTLGDVLDYLAKDNDKPSAVLLMIDGVHNLAGKPMKLPEDDPLRIFLCNVVSGDYFYFVPTSGAFHLPAVFLHCKYYGYRSSKAIQHRESMDSSAKANYCPIGKRETNPNHPRSAQRHGGTWQGRGGFGGNHCEQYGAS